MYFLYIGKKLPGKVAHICIPGTEEERLTKFLKFEKYLPD